MSSPTPKASFQFPQSVMFRKPWRAYQSRVLDSLDTYLTDRRVHVVAAPGSGKTVLGLEIVRRLNCPTLVLAPTLTIRDQWVERFVEAFLPEGQAVPAWVSTDLAKPASLTISTYQALHYVCTGRGRPEELDEGTTEDGPAPSEDEEHAHHQRRIALPMELLQVGFGTLVVDEAHHLRTEWWRVLTATVTELGSPAIVALTATPPYDVTRFEWDRYEEFCGAVDAEVSAPELVLSGDLCPHQDLVFCSVPTARDAEALTRHFEGVEQLLVDLKVNQDFLECVGSHAWVHDPQKNAEEILERPEEFTSMLVFLHHAGRPVPGHAVELLGGSVENLPEWDATWAETLLTHCLFSGDAHFDGREDVLKPIRRRLYDMKTVERRTVTLRHPAKLEKLLTTSVAKLESIVQIARLEWGQLGTDLRMVVLADFIRKSELQTEDAQDGHFHEMGVVPIFEQLLRNADDGVRLGVLCGSLVILPSDVESELQRLASASGHEARLFRSSPLAHDPRYSQVEFFGAGQGSAVQIVTQLFAEGHFHVLVGTKSLLGEGWDAPFINTLVLASFVGSFMLSNQMRGRSIRACSGQPSKTANIWHLVCLQPGEFGPGGDYDTLSRRCNAFVGLSFRKAVLESGLGRLGLGEPPFTAAQIEDINRAMTERARERDSLAARWKASLANGGTVVASVIAPQEMAPRHVLLPAMLRALAVQAVSVGLYVLARGLEGMRGFRNASPETVQQYLVVVLAVASLVAFPPCLYALWLFLRHGTIERSFRQVGEVVFRGLSSAGVFRTDLGRLKVETTGHEGYTTSCWLDGSTPRESAIFNQALREVLDPLKNPRYVLASRSWFGWFRREDYHAVPEALARRKEDAERFASLWSQRVAPVQLVFTRTADGRQVLLRARCMSLTARLQRQTERLSCWR
jgi:hypothetical protein